MSKRLLQMNRRRDRILEAAVEMMTTVDYADIAVKEVASRSGVALATLYRYFGSKDQLMAAALLSWSAGFGAFSTRTTDAPTLDKVKAVFGRAAKAFQRAPTVYGALMHLQASPDPTVAAAFGTFTGRQMDAFAASVSALRDDTRDDVLRVMIAVLSEALRGQQLGTLSHGEVRRRIDRAAELLLTDR